MPHSDSDTLRVAFVLRTKVGIMGTNAASETPAIVSRFHNVLVIEGGVHASEADTLTGPNNGAETEGNFRAITVESDQLRPQKIVHALEEFRPHIVHIYFHDQAFAIAAALRAAYRSAVRIVLDIRTPLLETNRRQRFLRQIRYMIGQRYIDHVFTHDEHSRKTVLPISALPTSLLPPGIHKDAIRKRSFRPITKDVKLVYAGAIAKRREIPILVEEFAALDAEPDLQHYSISLDIIGGGNATDQVAAEIEKHGLKNKVRLRGMMRHSELLATLADYDIGINRVPLPLYSHAPSLKCLEYLAAGLSVVSTRTVSAENLRQKGFRIALAGNNPQSFSTAVQTAIRHLDDSTVSPGCEQYLKAMNWQNLIVDNLLPHYQALTEAKH